MVHVVHRQWLIELLRSVVVMVYWYSLVQCMYVRTVLCTVRRAGHNILLLLA